MSRGRSYCRGRLKRLVDVVVSVAGLVALAPLMLVLWLAVFLTSGWPVFFVQERIGLDGRPFRLIKFRTMRRMPGGLPLTGSGDPRVTFLGRFLRAGKLDELPQLVHVARGEMSVVGPRPEVPRYVARYTPDQLKVLETRPGLTDPASVLFRDEESLLGSVPDDLREEFYFRTVLPKKLRLNLEYIERASVGYDLLLMLQTIRAVVRPSAP